MILLHKEAIKKLEIQAQERIADKIVETKYKEKYLETVVTGKKQDKIKK